MLNCQKVTELLSESQERSLSLTERMPLQIHMMMCSGCRNFSLHLDSIRKITRAFAKGENERVEKDKD